MSSSVSEVSAAPFAGLTPTEVLASRREGGSNLLTPPPREPWYRQWLAKFADPVIRILMIAAAIQIAVGAVKGEYIEGLAIVVAILLATTLAFVNEYRAGREFDVLNQVSDDVPVTAIREGRYLTVPKRDLVVGDVILLSTGDEVPADGAILEAVSLTVSESSLTGESKPVRKYLPDVSADPPKHEPAYPADQTYRGTTVTEGHGVVRLSAVGDKTELGRLGAKAAEQTAGHTPLTDQLDRLAKWIGVVGLTVAAGTFLVLVVRGALLSELQLSRTEWAVAASLFVGTVVALHRVWLKVLVEGLHAAGLSGPVPEWIADDTPRRWLVALIAGLAVSAAGLGIAASTGTLAADPGTWLPAAAARAFLNFFMIAVVIVVVAVPEGLAMAVTLSLAYSMRKMTAQNTLVRKMHACETVGAATVICSDKTGTLTENKMVVAETRFPASAETEVAAALAVNSTANLSRENGVVRALGNPTEGAILLWLDARGVNYQLVRTGFRVAAQLPFSTDRKLMATLGSGPDEVGVLFVKGAPEVVLAASTVRQGTNGELLPLTATDRSTILAELMSFQTRGMRTLGVAARYDVDLSGGIDTQLDQLGWLGFVAIADPVRADVPAAVAACQRAGLDVKIVTGDTIATAREVGRQIGLVSGEPDPSVELTGAEFAALPDPQAAEVARSLKILARARPLDKLRLVNLLQNQGAVVAVTGDGTNDAPALNHAKVGLAMGQAGSAVAKEAADIVLLDDSFGTIVTAVKWGRGLYENIQRFILFQLTINVAALGVALTGPFLGVDLPLTVLQMLWVNLIMDTLAALALATEPPDPAVLNRPPRNPAAFIITRPMAVRIFGVGGLFLAILLAFLQFVPPTEAVQSPGDHSTAWWLTVFFCVFVLLQFWNLFNARAFGTDRNALSGLRRNPAFLVIAAIILIGQILLVQFGGDVFRTVPLTVTEWAIIIGGTAPVLVLGEVLRRRDRRQLLGAT